MYIDVCIYCVPIMGLGFAEFFNGHFTQEPQKIGRSQSVHMVFQDIPRPEDFFFRGIREDLWLGMDHSHQYSNGLKQSLIPVAK